VIGPNIDRLESWWVGQMKLIAIWTIAKIWRIP